MKTLTQYSIGILFCGSASAQLVAQSLHLAETCTPHSIFPVIPASGFEPSDAAWDASSQLLYLVDDNGRLAAIPGHLLLSNNDATSDAFETPSEDDKQVVLQKKKKTVADGDVKIWNVSDDGDLEGCALDHDFPELVYLGVESPAEIIAFNVTSASIQHRYPVDSFFSSEPVGFSVDGQRLKKHKKNKKSPKNGNQDPMLNSGLESLAFIPGSLVDSPCRIVAGRQSDARVFVFELSADRTAVQFVGSVVPPGPGKDLSSMSLFLGDIYFLYDKEQQAVSIPLTQFTAALEEAKPNHKSHGMGRGVGKKMGGMGVGMQMSSSSSSGPGSMHKRSIDEKKKGMKWTATVYKFDVRGQEGLAFAYTNFECALGSRGCDKIDETPVVYAVDPPRKPKFKKDVLVGSFGQLQQCFRV